MSMTFPVLENFKILWYFQIFYEKHHYGLQSKFYINRKSPAHYRNFHDFSMFFFKVLLISVTFPVLQYSLLCVPVLAWRWGSSWPPLSLPAASSGCSVHPPAASGAVSAASPRQVPPVRIWSGFREWARAKHLQKSHNAVAALYLQILFMLSSSSWSRKQPSTSHKHLIN